MAALQRTSPAPNLSPQSPRSALRKATTPRGLRLNVRDNRKEAIVTSSTLDFISLSACDKEMVQECDESHAQTEARKRIVVCTAGPSAETKKPRRSLVVELSKSPALSSEGPSSELGDFDLRLMKLPKANDPVRPQSSRGGGSRAGDSLLGDTSPRPRLGVVPPLLRSLRLYDDVRFRPPSSLLGHCPASLAGASSSLKSVRSSPHDLNLTSRPPRTSTETPPGVPNAFEAHAMLVRCPAPRRPARFMRPSSNARRPRSALALDL